MAFCSPLPFSRPCRTTSALRRHRTHIRVCATRPMPSSPAKTAPVLRPSSTPAWDSGSVTGPIVKRYLTPDGFSYAMWYTAQPSTTSDNQSASKGTRSGIIGLALSDDGLSWERVPGPEDGAVLGPNKDDWWWFDTKYVLAGDIVMGENDRVRADAGVYFMYYAGGDAEVVDVATGNGMRQMPGLRMRIGLALSKDGEHFTRIEGDFPSGAVLEPGPPGSFDELFVTAPTVTRPLKPKSEQHRYVMHYHTFDVKTQQFAIGRALSKDGFRFERDQDGPVLTGMRGEDDALAFAAKGVSRRSVVERTIAKGKRFAMFVECLGDDSIHRIGLCESDGCETWGPISLVLSPTVNEDSWDGAGVSHPNAVEMDDGSVRLYYVGKSKNHSPETGNGFCIGMARSNGTDWMNLQRIPGVQVLDS